MNGTATFPVVRFIFGGEEAVGAGSGRPYTVVYDGTCKVCGRLIKLLDRWDTREEIEVIPSQNTSVHARFPWIPAEAYAEAVQLIGPGGRTWQGAEAIEQLLTILPRGGLLGWVFKLPSPIERRIAFIAGSPRIATTSAVASTASSVH